MLSEADTSLAPASAIVVAMVLSASTVLSYQIFGSAYTLWFRQVMFAVVGLVAMVAASRMPVTFYRRLAYPLLIFAVVSLVAVLVIGHSVAGQRNWIELGGPFRFQPSEFAKLALVLWASDLMARKQGSIHQWKHLLVPLVPVALLIVGLVLLEGDVGTALVMVPMLAAVLYVNGAPMRLFVAGALAVLGGVAGILISFWGVDFIISLLPADEADFYVQYFDFGIDRKVIVFSMIVALGSAFLFGLVPAVQASRPDINECLKEGGGAGA